MTLILELPRELEARLRQQAEQEGLDEAVVAVRALNDQLASIPPLALLTDVEVLERIRLQGFSDEFWERYHELRGNETLPLIGQSPTSELSRL